MGIEKGGQLLGVVRKEKDPNTRIKQRKALKEARTGEAAWRKRELERFVRKTKAEIFYYYVSDGFLNCWEKEDIEILRKRRENIDASEWRGLSEQEWKRFWETEYQDGIWVFMFEPCIVVGGYCKDGQTISAYLQDNLIAHNHTLLGVLNRGVCGF